MWLQNHQRFTLRCLNKGVTRVSLKLKNNIRTHKSDCIIQKVEKSLINERIRNVNNILDCHEHDSYMYTQNLSAILEPDLTKECEKFMKDLKEARDLKVMEWQKEKFERLWHIKSIAALAKGAKILTKVATQNRSRSHQSWTPQCSE